MGLEQQNFGIGSQLEKVVANMQNGKEKEVAEADAEGVEEISLDTPEDLQKFLSIAEQACQEVLRYEDWAKRNNYSGLSTADLDGIKLFDAVRERIEIIRDLVETSPDLITDEDIQQMQDNFDDLLTLRDHAAQVHNQAMEMPEAGVVEAETVSDEVSEPVEEAKAERLVLDDSMRIPADDSTSNNNEESPVVSEEISDEPIELEKPAAAEIEEKLAEAHVEIARVILTGIEIRDKSSASGKLQSEGYLAREFKTSLDRAHDVQERLRTLPDSEVSVTELERELSIISEIEANIKAIEDVLNRKEDTPEPEKEVEQSVEDEKNNVVSEAEEIDAAESTASEKVATTEPEKAERNPSSYELMPNEADVAAALKTMNQNQFYTTEERQTARSMAESFHRAVAEGKSPDTIRKIFKSLNEYIENLDVKPGPDYLAERITRIEGRVKNASTESGIADAINTLKEDYERIRTEDPTNEDRYVSAYKTVEETALMHEDEWLSVCGMRMPKAGPEGVFSARSLREGLSIARDRHADLRQYPEKKVLVDRMIRILGTVPDSGLSDADVAELNILAREVDSPDKLVEDVRKKEGGGKSKSNNIELSDEKNESSDANAAKLEVTKDVEDDGPVTLKDKTSSTEEGVANAETDAETIAWEDNPDRVEFPSSAEDRIKARTEASDADVIEIDPNEVAQEAEAAIAEEHEEKTVAEDLPDADEEVLAEVEEHDPVNEAVPEPDERPTVRSWQERRADAGSLIEMDGLVDQYSDFFDAYEPTEFDRVMRSEVAAYERKLADGLEGFLGIKRNSAFELMKRLSISDIYSLLGQFDAGRRHEFEEEFNVSYGTFVSWCDQIAEMRGLVDVDDSVSFGELYARWIIEQEMS